MLFPELAQIVEEGKYVKILAVSPCKKWQGDIGMKLLQKDFSNMKVHFQECLLLLGHLVEIQVTRVLWLRK